MIYTDSQLSVDEQLSVAQRAAVVAGIVIGFLIWAGTIVFSVYGTHGKIFQPAVVCSVLLPIILLALATLAYGIIYVLTGTYSWIQTGRYEPAEWLVG
jgi:uncharacterized membrane protein (DUF106 family)